MRAQSPNMRLTFSQGSVGLTSAAAKSATIRRQPLRSRSVRHPPPAAAATAASEARAAYAASCRILLKEDVGKLLREGCAVHEIAQKVQRHRYDKVFVAVLQEFHHEAATITQTSLQKSLEAEKDAHCRTERALVSTREQQSQLNDAWVEEINARLMVEEQHVSELASIKGQHQAEIASLKEKHLCEMASIQSSGDQHTAGSNDVDMLPIKSSECLGGRWMLLSLPLGSGSYGDVYAAVDSKTRAEVAIKLSATPTAEKALINEAEILRRLHSHAGFPKVQDVDMAEFGTFLVMDRLGPSLDDLHSKCGRQFSLETTCMLCVQMLDRIEALHSIGFVHRDIKPSNLCMGLGQQIDTVHMIDFGTAKSYINPHTNRHSAMTSGHAFVGTLRFAPHSAHAGLEQGRKDDLESLFYIFMFLLAGRLPWQDAPPAKIQQMKITYFAGTASRGSCSELWDETPCDEYLRAVRALTWDETPCYEYLRNLFQAQIGDGSTYDWSPIARLLKRRKMGR